MLETFMMKAEEAICDLMNFIVIQNQNLQTPQRGELMLEASKLIRAQIELAESRYRVENFRFDLFQGALSAFEGFQFRNISKSIWQKTPKWIAT